MDKNSIIGLVLMGLLLFGFTFFQNKQYQKQQAYQAQLDSIAAVERFRADSAAAAQALRDTLISDDQAHVFLLVTYGDSTQEQVSLPLVLTDKGWRMR